MGRWFSVLVPVPVQAPAPVQVQVPVHGALLAHGAVTVQVVAQLKEVPAPVLVLIGKIYCLTVFIQYLIPLLC